MKVAGNICIFHQKTVPSDAGLQYNNHPRRMPLLPKAEGRSAFESTVAQLCE